MSQSIGPINQSAAGQHTQQEEEKEVESLEAFTDEPPDLQQHSFLPASFDLDAFATSSLQAAASAVLAAQEKDDDLFFDSSGNVSGPQNNGSADLSRSSSIGHSGEQSTGHRKEGAAHPERHMWTQVETKALVDGCNKHGIGNWKAILNDEDLAPHFNGRTPGDLKDRFRTYFPDAYHELYPNAKTHTSRAVRSKAPDGKSIFEKGKTKERRPFTTAEDEVLRKGYEQFGSHWAIIAKDAVFEGRRKSTDLRDRFRNAFPSLYEQAGYKPRAKTVKKERRQSSSTGSFSHPERPHIVQDSVQRPGLQPRSETSTSAHSQAVSEHSELSDEGEVSDFVERGHGKDRSGSESVATMDSHHAPTGSHQAAMNSVANMERSHSHGVSTTSSESVPQADTPRSSASVASGHALPKPHPPQSLRRSQSTKRASCKVGSLDQAVKTAFSKSSKEAVIASHQQAHMQHMLQQQHQRPTATHDASSYSVSRPQLGQSFSTGWLSRSSWLPSDAAPSAAQLADMDLDQMDEILNSHSASELLAVGQQENSVTGRDTQTTSSAPVNDESMSLDDASATADQNQADFANFYQQIALAAHSSTGNRAALSIDSFQDLLDPVLPLTTSGITGWEQGATNLPWTPVSSASANNVPTHASTNATRRDHEHNHWAGDLLHRGSYQAQEHADQQSFVTMASMHLPQTSEGIPSSRSADATLGQQRGDSAFARQISGQQIQTSVGQQEQRPAETGALDSTLSVHELISRSARRQSFPPRPTGWNEEAEEAMQAANFNIPYFYPADDISLLNSSANASLTLFPSLVHNQTGDYGPNGMMRRRRSTDTLREGAFTFPQAWKGGLLDSVKQHIDEQPELTTKADGDRHIEAASSSSLHATSEHSRSISDAHTNADDVEAPSRAASVGNLDLAGQRDNILYAESLPDLSSSIGEHVGGTSDSTFSHNHNLQISYDDMDLPSFLNRSPSFAQLGATNLTNFSPRLSVNEGVPARSGARAWPFTLAQAQGGRGEELFTNQIQGQSRNVASDFTRGATRSVDLTQHAAFTNFASNPMKDAGALDRLEHLYLEGLHTPSSPLHLSQSVGNTGPGTGVTGYGGQASANSGFPTVQRGLGGMASNWPWTASTQLNIDRNPAASGGGADASGYESV